MNETSNINVEEYTRAMNFIGQNLLATLGQAVDKLPQTLRNEKVISQALAAFLTNVVYKYSPHELSASQNMLEQITNTVQVQLKQIAQAASQ